jgi:tetratricopeptide (TPR) repeat protein
VTARRLIAIATGARRTAAALVALAALCAVRPAAAFTIEYSLDRAPALVACDKQLYSGKRAEAQACYLALLAGDADERVKADAARASGDVRAANSFFQAAVKKFPEDAAVRVRWGELFLSTHQANEAQKLFQEALELKEDYAPAKLGLAKIFATRFDERAREMTAGLIKDAPDASVEAYLLLARAALEDGKTEEADAELDKALALAEKHKQTPLEIYALKASADLLRGTTDSPWTKKALALNAGYGDVYAVPAYFYVITRRYREAIELYRRAVEVEPSNYQAHADLGVNLLRENKVDEASQHLQVAYRGDPFSAPIVNTLRLIDSFGKFDVLTHVPGDETAAALPARVGGSQAPAGPPAKNPGVIMRLHKDESAVLEPYVLGLANKAIQAYSKRYGFELKEPVIVELYPEHDDFAVRTSGLPGIGLLGVTFGYLVAMDSPTGRADSDFHWGTTLWHELAHVFTLEKTKHLVPRWFSEGVSVYEEWSTGPLPGRHIPLAVMQAIKEDKFLPIVDLDKGFIHPSYEAQVIVSYMQAGLICEYVAGRFGQQGLEHMLDHYAQGKDTAGAIRGALDISPEQFDKDFAAYVKQQLGSAVEKLDEWQAVLKEAHQSLNDKKWKDAAESAAKAIELYPDYVDEGSAYLVAARAARELADNDRAVATLQDFRKRGGHDPDALVWLAKTLGASGKNADAIAVLDDALMVAPLRAEVHSELGDRLLAANQPARAVVEYKALLAMNPHELAEAHFKLAKAYVAAQDRAKGREHLLYALEIAPSYREAQQLLLEVVR